MPTPYRTALADHLRARAAEAQRQTRGQRLSRATARQADDLRSLAAYVELLPEDDPRLARLARAAAAGDILPPGALLSADHPTLVDVPHDERAAILFTWLADVVMLHESLAHDDAGLQPPSG